MDISTGKVGRILFALPFLVFGLFHFVGAQNMAGMVPVPGGAFWVYFTGIALIAAAVAVLIGKMGRLASQLLGVLMLVFALTVHLPGVMGGGDMAQISMVGLLKDISLAGGCFVLADLFPAQGGKSA